jgi:hypothetical protein
MVVYMEELPTKNSRLYRNRKLIAVAILLILGPPIALQVINAISSYATNPNFDGYTEPRYSLTVWILPGDEEFHLHLDFYGSEQGAYISDESDRYVGLSIRVEPLDNEKNNVLLYRLPENTMSVWVKIYFNEYTEEPNLLININIGNKITLSLEEHEISILIEPWSGDEG